MSKVLITRSKLDNLANTISSKSGASLPLTIDQMDAAVESISGGGVDTSQDTVDAAHLLDGYTAHDSNGDAITGEYVPSSPTLQAKTNISPSTSSQTIQADNGYDGLSSVQINAMPSGSVSASAAKGSVSNHAISVTPTATVGTAGYLAAGSTNGTAVSVSASELVSGSQTITENDTYDVTNLASVVVNVSGGASGAKVDTIEGGTLTASSISFAGLKGEPIAFNVMVDLDLATGTPAKVAALVYDGTGYHAQTVTNTSNAQASYLSSGFGHTYSGGTLTITSSNASFATSTPYFVTYAYGGSSANVGTSDVQVGSGATSITFAGLEDEPICWSCVFKSNFGTSSGYQRVMFVQDIGTIVNGVEMDSSASPSMHWTASYSNGSLTITSNGTNQGGYFHQPGYYQLTYVIGEPSPYQAKTVTPTTSQQIVEPDTGYEALSQVTVEAMPSMTLPTAASGTSSGTSKATITPTSSVQYLNIPTGYNSSAAYYTIAAASGGSVTVKTTTVSNTSATATQIQFTSLTGQPKAFFCRCTSNLSRNSSNRYYYIADIRWDGSSTGGVTGNKYYVYNGQYSNQTTGYSQSYSNGTLTLTTTGSQTASPGSFYNGTYELVYVY